MTQTQKTMFTTRQMPWTKLGTVIDKPVTPAEAIKLAKLDWTVSKEPLYVSYDKKLTQVEDRYAIMRSTDKTVLGTVGTNYEPFQNAEAFEFLSGLVDDPELAVIEAAGQVRGGRQVFVVVRFPGLLDDVLDGDAHELYAIVRTGHDGLKAVQVVLMPVRGLCMNMLGLATFGNNAPQRWSIRHTSTLPARLAEAKHTLDGATAYAEEYCVITEQLAASQIAEAELRELLEDALPMRPTTQRTVDRVLERFHNSETIPDRFRGTSYGALNALTEELDWGKDLTAEGRYHSGLDTGIARTRNRVAAALLVR